MSPWQPNPPHWTDSYYGKNTEYPGLEHVVGAPVFAGPDHSALVQIPYLLAILIRRYIEMQANDTLGTSVTEVKNVHRWFGAVMEQCLEYPYSTVGNQGAHGLFRALAPPVLREGGDGARLRKLAAAGAGFAVPNGRVEPCGGN